MPSFTTEVPHTLGKEKAVEKLRSFLDGVVEKYKDQVSKMDGDWTDNVLDFSLTTFGFSISGKLTVEDEVAQLDGQLPFAALAFRGKIEKGIAAELERAFPDVLMVIVSVVTLERIARWRGSVGVGEGRESISRGP